MSEAHSIKPYMAVRVCVPHPRLDQVGLALCVTRGLTLVKFARLGYDGRHCEWLPVGSLEPVAEAADVTLLDHESHLAALCELQEWIHGLDNYYLPLKDLIDEAVLGALFLSVS